MAKYIVPWMGFSEKAVVREGVLRLFLKLAKRHPSVISQLRCPAHPLESRTQMKLPRKNDMPDGVYIGCNMSYDLLALVGLVQSPDRWERPNFTAQY